MIDKITLEPKYPDEIVPYGIDFIRLSSFASGTDTIGSMLVKIYNTTDVNFTTDLASSMVYATSVPSDTVAQIDVMSGTAGQSYLVMVKVTCPSGRIYYAEAVFSVKAY